LPSNPMFRRRAKEKRRQANWANALCGVLAQYGVTPVWGRQGNAKRGPVFVP
jgi:hypothetical protein